MSYMEWDKLPDTNVEAHLKRVFSISGDACIKADFHDPIKRRVFISLPCPNQDLAEFFRLLLIALGIESRVDLMHFPVCRVRIVGKDNIEKFAEKIGFSSTEKQNRLIRVRHWAT